MILREYKKEDGIIIASWLQTEEELYKWSADRFNKYPLSGEDIYKNYAPQLETGRFYPLTAIDEEENVVGHFIIRYPKADDDSTVRFGFVIVDPSFRGKGYGKEMLLLGVDYVKKNLSASKIDLGVFENNEAARHCYEAVGFREYGIRECDMPIGTWNCIDMEMILMEMISNYMRDEKSRHMLNDLTRKTFEFDFEGWVTNGYFEGEYIPYSLTGEGRMLSNVSANRMKFLQNGEEKYYIQIGTVMTDEAYRKQGLASRLIKHVISEYENECDGIYLFGNLDAIGFYEKMGFKIVNEYKYFVKNEFTIRDDSKEAFQPISDMDDEVKNHYLDMVRSCLDLSSFAQTNKYGLQMFYTGEFYNVFYAKDIDCFIVLDQEDGTILQSVLCKENVSLSEILKRIDLPGGCALGFTPRKEDMDICTCEKYDGADDYRLFYMGKELENIERDRLYFPELSHA